MADSSRLTPLGVTGLRQWGGYLQEEFLRELQGARGRARLREFRENDPIAGAILFAFETLARQADWRVAPFSDAPEDATPALLVDEALHDMETPFADTLGEILSVLPYGFSLFEPVYKLRDGDHPDDPARHSKHNDGRLGWRCWSPRPQDTIDRWEFAEDGTPTAAIQVAAPDYRPRTLPLNRLLHFRAGARKGSPEGRSILRSAYTSWYFKSNIQRIEAIGIERDLAGFPVMWVPANVLLRKTADDVAAYDEFAKILRNLRRDEQEGLMMPLVYDEKGNKSYDFGLVSTGSRRQFDTDAIIARYDQRIAMTVLADFLLLGHEAVGSFALSSDKTDLFAVALGAFMDAICAVVNEKAIPDLLRLNGMRVDRAPQLVHGDIEKPDIAAIGSYVQVLANVGVDLSDPELQRHLLEIAGLPVPVQEDEADDANEAEQEAEEEGEKRAQRKRVRRRLFGVPGRKNAPDADVTKADLERAARLWDASNDDAHAGMLDAEAA